MKKTILTLALGLVTLCGQAQTPEDFKPYQATSLRLPSVPVIVNDPYFSVWSPYDRLTDGPTRHWTDDEKPIDGLLRVDGKTYSFMGGTQKVVLEAIAPMAEQQAWKARYTHATPSGPWQQAAFDDSGWKWGEAAFGSHGLNSVRTQWDAQGSDLYVRREVSLTDADLQQDLYLIYSHDDVFELYVNGTKVADTGETWVDNVRLHLTDKLKALLRPGRNVIAAHCHNTTGGAYTDFGLFRNTAPAMANVETALQTSVSVMATNTYYTFKCGPVALDLVFTAPMLIDDLDLLSTPINYISYQVRSLDKKQHQVQLLFTASPLLAANKATQPMSTQLISHKGTDYIKTGTIDQPILAKKGDGICIDWGYLYLPAVNGQTAISNGAALLRQFTESGTLPATMRQVTSRTPAEHPALAYLHDFGQVTTAASYAMIGYDEVQDIEYMYNRYKGYWAHGGKVTIFDAFDKLKANYRSIMDRCRSLDKTIYDDALAAGGKKYAEILAGSYRQCIAAHKLFKDNEGHLLFFSKENNSNGCVNTVDLTYPSAPIFLIYNPVLEKAMMTSIFEYSRSGRWTKPFPAHDLGTYPIADGQVYGGDMPLEEGGNMLTLAAELCLTDGNTDFVAPYWDIMRTWADYLSENGQDPANQLCTDDFAGHWPHNCNLSVKAIMGVAAFGIMAKIKGDEATAGKYMDRAREMARQWEKAADDGDHYRLAFDRPGTWSQKYNIVWDKLWGTGLFSEKVMEKEVSYYLAHQNKYGLPLDCRRDYSKSDWIMWTAALAKDKKTFQKFVNPMWDYINETASRVPISDWFDTKTALMTGFKARSVIGGHWMRVLLDKRQAK